MMKRTLLILLILASASFVYAQKTSQVQGVVSYVTSQNVYVKFESTDNINTGDTLFSNLGGKLVPALLVNNKSSVSCVCSRMQAGQTVKVNDTFLAIIILPPTEIKTEKKKEEPAVLPPPTDISPTTLQEETGPKQLIKGRISAASYSNLTASDESHRMQYAFSFTGNNLGKSRFSTDAYVTFRHTLGEWETVKANPATALKVYALAVKYDFSKTGSVTLGRKINPRIANMGAIDGLQTEIGLKNVLFGAIAGTRPDYTDYNFNANLFQYGAYVAHVSGKTQKYQQSTFAYAEQRNQAKTDRRFVYFQHTNDLLKNLNVFASCEMDLYKNIDSVAENKLSLTNLYFSLRYKISKRLNVSAAYDNRKNIIYYESYKNFIDKLIEDETRQGLRFSANYKFFKNINWGVNSSWRFQKSGINDSKNLNSYLTFGRVPWLNITATLNANLLQTNYLNSKMFGARLSREIIPRKLNGELNYRYVDYRYTSSEYKILQHVGGVDLSWRFTKNLSLYLYYEGTFQADTKMQHRINTKLIQRF